MGNQQGHDTAQAAEPNIHRHADGSIDYGHYLRLGRRRRAIAVRRQLRSVVRSIRALVGAVRPTGAIGREPANMPLPGE